MYAQQIDYDSLERAQKAAKTRVKARAAKSPTTSRRPLPRRHRISQKSPTTSRRPRRTRRQPQLLYEPAEDFYARQELPLLEGDEDDDDFEPCAYAYERGLCPELDGHYNLPDILGNAIYYKPTAAELARAEHNRTYGVTEGDDGIYSILFDQRGRPRGGKSGSLRRQRTKNKRAQRAAAIRARIQA